MPTISAGSQYRTKIEPGNVLIVVASASGSGVVRRLGSSGADVAGQIKNIPAGATRRFGPFPTERIFNIEVGAGTFQVDEAPDDYGFATAKGNVEPFTGAVLLRPEDNGKLFRCDDASNVVITAPGDLPEGFNVAFAQWSTGTVTFAAGTGMTARSTKLAVSAQYAMGSLIVMKAGEFVTGGSVS